MKRFFTALFIFCTLYTEFILAKDITLPSMGPDSSKRLSAEDEKVLGDAFMRSVRLQLPISEDPEVSEYIWHLGYRLVATSSYKEKSFHFFIVNQPSINAFAGPAGYIGINAGLILATETESEIAAVLAHEIAHITQRHLDRAFSAAEKISLPTAAAIVAAIILGGQNVNIAEAALAATIAANVQSQLNFSREHEMEADHIGIQILTNAQFDADAMPAFFERLQQNERLFDVQVPEFLRTHPVTLTRISESRARSAQYPLKPSKYSDDYILIKEKLRVAMSQSPNELINYYEALLDTQQIRRKRISSLYGYANVLLITNHHQKAKATLNKLLKIDKKRIPYIVLQAEIEFSLGNNAKTQDIYESGLKLHPNNKNLLLSYAAALLQMNKPQQAKSYLKPLLKDRPSPIVYELLSKAAGETNQPGAALQMLAEYYFLYAQTSTAIDQLGLALRQPDVTPKMVGQIQMRINELRKIALAEQQF